MLPLEIWHKISDYIPNPDLLEFVRLSQVSREFRQAFLSDLVWAKFDVYGVGQQTPKPAYRFKNYTLSGIAAHFFNHWFSFTKTQQRLILGHATAPYNVYALKVSQDLYVQMLLICKIPCFEKIQNLVHMRERVFEEVELDVWKLWSTHLLEPVKPICEKNVYGWVSREVQQSKQVCLALIKTTKVKHLDPILATDADINIALIKRGQAEDVMLSRDLLRNKEFVLESLHLLATRSHPWRHTRIKEELCSELSNDRDVVLATAFTWPDIIKTLPANFCDDREIVMAAVQQEASYLQYASRALQADRDLVLKAIKNGAEALKYASEDLKADREIVLAAVNRSSCALRFASEGLRADREIVLAAVNHWGGALEHASEDLKADREIALAAVNRWSHALKYVSDALRNDREAMLLFVQQKGYTLRYASEALRGDSEIVLAAVLRDWCALKWVSENFCSGGKFHIKTDNQNRNLLLAAAKQSFVVLKYASMALRNDREIVLASVQERGWTIKYASHSLRTDRDIMLAAIQSHATLLESSGRSLWKDKNTVLDVLRQDETYVSQGLLDDRDFVLAAVAQDANALKFASSELQADKTVVLTAVKVDGSSIAFAAEELKSNPEILEAVAASKDNLSRNRVAQKACVTAN